MIHSIWLPLGAALAASIAFATPSRAEGNRLLPFWAQPYPYGYARVEAEPVPSFPPCRSLYDRRGTTARADDPRCHVVLHARD